jgi:hypothetical protein
MTPPPTEPSKQPTSAETPSSNTLKFSKKQLALAFVIAGISDAIGAFITPLPPIGWVGILRQRCCFHGAGTAVVAITGTGSGGHSGLGRTSILVAGGWSDCCPGHSSTEV